MKTRRRFLAEAGVALSGLILPGAAHAWGWRRRRVICCPPAPCVWPEQEPAAKALMAPPFADCTCLHAVESYGHIDDFYYYECVCCPLTLEVWQCAVEAALPVGPDCPAGCGLDHCDATICIPVGPFRMTAAPSSPSAALDRRHKGFVPSKKHANDGIKDYCPDNPKKVVEKGHTLDDLQTIGYTAHGKRIVARIFKWTRQAGGPDLYVGIQMSTTPKPAHEGDFNPASSHGYCHRVKRRGDNVLFDILTHK